MIRERGFERENTSGSGSGRTECVERQYLRGIVYPTVGSVLVIVTMLAGTDRALMAYTVVGLSVDAHYYLTTPLPALSTGITSPGAVYVPLTVVPGTILLARHLFRVR